MMFRPTRSIAQTNTAQNSFQLIRKKRWGLPEAKLPTLSTAVLKTGR
jgi:hypothetical protein